MKITTIAICFFVSHLCCAQSLVFTSFHQGNVPQDQAYETCSDDHERGNCVAVALIKTCLSEFGGINNVFKSYTQSSNGVSCTFHDGVTATVSNDELQIAKTMANFQSNPQPDGQHNYFNDANTIYALICKRVEDSLKLSNCVRKFTDAVTLVNYGYNTKSASKLLGIKFQKVSIFNLNKYKYLIVNSGVHTVYYEDGYYDYLGQRRKFKLLTMKNPGSGRSFIKSAFLPKI